MKKFFLILLIVLASFLIILYAAFLTLPLPVNHFFNFDKYKAQIQKLVLENSKLNLNYSKIKLYSTPLLSLGAIVENPDISFEDGSTFIKASKIKGGIALPSLITLTIKTSKCYIENLFVNLEIVDGKQYKIVEIIEDIINENNAKQKLQTQEDTFVLPERLLNKIRIKVPSVAITNSIAKIEDLKTSNNLTLDAKKLVLGYNSANNTAKIETISKLYSNDNENISLDAKISLSIPEFEAVDEGGIDPEEKIQIPFLNPVEIYQTYDLKTNVVSRLKIRDTKSRGLVIHGFFNVDDFSLKLSDAKLPNSFLHTKFYGKKIEYEGDIYAHDDEKISLEGDIKYGKNPQIKTKIISDKIHFANVVRLLEGLLDSLSIKNDLSSIETTGYLNADATIKTDFKQLKSNGSITVNDASFVHPGHDVGIRDIAANFVFDNNILNIKDSHATINGSKLTLEGIIDNKSNADIKLNVDDLSLPALYDSFAPREIKKAYKLNSAKLSAHIDIKGKLENLNAKLKTKLKDLKVTDSKKNFILQNKETNFTLDANPKSVSGLVENDGFVFNLLPHKTAFNIDKLTVDIDDKDLVINPFDVNYNSASKINIKGNISNYLKNPDIDIFAKAQIATQNLKQSLGEDISPYFSSRGVIPAKVSIKGNHKKQEILAQIYSDSNNFITPLNITSLVNSPSLAQADIKIHGNKIKIKNSGLYKKAKAGFSDNLIENMEGAIQIADLTAIVDNDHINLLRLNILEELNSQIAFFKKSNFKAKGKIVISGNLDNLSYRGDFRIWDLIIPEALFAIKNLDFALLKDTLSVKAKQVNVNGSVVNGSLHADLKPYKVFKINNIEFSSDLMDLDKMLISADAVQKSLPKQQIVAKKPASNAPIPVYADGKFNIKKMKTGEILLDDIRGNLEVKNNNLFINKLNCKAFNGLVIGEIKMGLASGLLTIKLRGNDIDFDDLLTRAANMKDTISGNLKFVTDITLKGTTFEEQMKSLTGTINFESENGQYGPFSKLENFFLAENIRENPFFKNTIGVILTPIATIDSSRYEKLEGKLDFKNGIVKFSPITSQGDILCVLVSGNMNLLSNDIDSKVRVRLASAVSDLLGPIAMANPVNLVKNTPGLNIASASLFSLFTQVVTPQDYKEIPEFSSAHSDENATKFQIILKGDTAKPLKLVKSFKWLALQEQVDKAKEFRDNFIKEQEDLARQALIQKLQSEYEQNNKLKVGVEKVLKMDTTAPGVKKVLVEEIVKNKTESLKTKQEEFQVKNEELKQEFENKVQDAINSKREDFQNKIKSGIQNKLKVNNDED